MSSLMGELWGVSCNFRQKLEQLECLRSEDTPRHHVITPILLTKLKLQI